MEPPQKRPRLSIFAHQPSSDELDSARYQNDLQLKTRFEAIFEKYSQDFTCVGDEVDVFTGKIIVDNGHLASMAGEMDTGDAVSSAAGNGRSILRAMTAAPDREDPYFNEGADDVLMSIEAIAENAVITIEDSELDEDSEDDLFKQVDESTITQPLSSTSSPRLDRSHVLEPEADYISDSDSLFGGPEKARSSSPDSLFGGPDRERFSSPDSLFADELPQSGDEKSVSVIAGLHPLHPGSSFLDENSDENAIIAKFGESIGQEVLELIEKRANNEAHIEPAWRIPVKLHPRSKSFSTSNSITPAPAAVESVAQFPDASPQGISLWKAPRQRKSTGTAKSKQPLMRRRARSEESEDPLQADFTSDLGDMEQTPRFIEAADDLDWVPADDDEFQPGGDVRSDALEKEVRQGICPYCKLTFKNKNGVIMHLTSVLRAWDGGTEDGTHDMDWIRRRKPEKSKPPRGPRLLVCDFRTMVELHEGVGMSFAEIADSEALRTNKTEARLLDLYNKHRSPRGRGNLGDLPPSQPWTEEEEQILTDLCENPKTTLATVAKRLRGRPQTQIGDKLADGWLDELRQSGNLKVASDDAYALNVGQEVECETKDPTLLYHTDHHLKRTGTATAVRLGPSSTSFVMHIKAEDSEDDLFGNQ